MYKFSIILFVSLPLILCSQELQTNSSGSEIFYYAGFSFGRTYIQEDLFNGNIINFGLTVSKQKWPHVFKFTLNQNFEFRIGESKSTKGFISNVREINFFYDHLFQFPYLTKLFLGFGSGVGLIQITKNVGYKSEESAIKDRFIRLGIPFEIRFGFLYPSKKVNLLDFIYFFNWNSVNSFEGWKLNFNISIN